MKKSLAFLLLTSVCLVSNVFADQADDLRVLMRDARGAILANDIEGAIAFCDQALAQDANFAEAYANRAEAKGMKEDTEGALQDATKAIELAPHDPSVHAAYYARAVLSLDYDSQPQQALEFMNKAIELKSDDPFYYEFRGDIYEKLGNTELAEADFAKSDSMGQ